MALKRHTAHNWAKYNREQAKARTGRTETIAKLIERVVAETGLEPTDDDLARTLACSPLRIAHHRRLLRM